MTTTDAEIRKRNKYKNQPIVVDGIWFQSKKEAHRYSELVLHQRAGYIVGEIRRQVRYLLQVNGVKVCEYRADFVYLTNDGKQIVEDAKGMRAGLPYALFKIKSRLMLALLNIRVMEV